MFFYDLLFYLFFCCFIHFFIHFVSCWFDGFLVFFFFYVFFSFYSIVFYLFFFFPFVHSVYVNVYVCFLQVFPSFRMFFFSLLFNRILLILHFPLCTLFMFLCFSSFSGFPILPSYFVLFPIPIFHNFFFHQYSPASVFFLAFLIFLCFPRSSFFIILCNSSSFVYFPFSFIFVSYFIHILLLPLLLRLCLLVTFVTFILFFLTLLSPVTSYFPFFLFLSFFFPFLVYHSPYLSHSFFLPLSLYFFFLIFFPPHF